jgi:hypothetical protein
MWLQVKWLHAVNQQWIKYVCRWDGSKLWVTKYNANWQATRAAGIARIWEKRVGVGKWVSIVLAVRVSRNGNAGYVEIYFNGAKQKLMTGARKGSSTRAAQMPQLDEL